MGIAPITNLLPLSAGRTATFDLELLPMERVENSARTGDETYSPSSARAANGSESDEDEELDEELEDEAEEEPEEEPETLPRIQAQPRDPNRPVSFFA
jgi:hypothetical protein